MKYIVTRKIKQNGEQQPQRIDEARADTLAKNQARDGPGQTSSREGAQRRRIGYQRMEGSARRA